MTKKLAPWMYLLPSGLALWILFFDDALKLFGGSLGLLGLVLIVLGVVNLLKYLKKMF
ncbi:MAG: hypothetical protein WD712_02550 [Candidatus Spechtbacterales bacterium]